MKPIFLTATVAAAIVNGAFGAASVRAPQLGGGAVSGATPARAASMRTQTMKTTSTTAAPTVTASVETPVATDTTDARLSFLSSKINKLNVKNTDAAKQELNNIDARIEELQTKLDEAKADAATVVTAANIDSKIEEKLATLGVATGDKETYSKAEIDNLFAELEKRLPKVDDRGNWTDPNGNLIAVPEGAIVIGPDDVIIVDGHLSTTSTHPIQNKTVTNALNGKQTKSTELSFGSANGGWRPVADSGDYVHLYATTGVGGDIGGIGFDIKPAMIATSLDDSTDNQLITAGAVKNALDALTSNPGGGTQQGYDFYLQNITPHYDSLVTKYWFFAPGITTTAQEGELQNLVQNNICDGIFSEKWCFYENIAFQDGGLLFAVTKRNIGHYLQDYHLGQYWGSDGVLHTQLTKRFLINLPDDVGLTTYVQDNLCETRDTCHISTVWYNFDNPTNANNQLQAIYEIDMVQDFIR